MKSVYCDFFQILTWIQSKLCWQYSKYSSYNIQLNIVRLEELILCRDESKNAYNDYLLYLSNAVLQYGHGPISLNTRRFDPEVRICGSLQSEIDEGCLNLRMTVCSRCSSPHTICGSTCFCWQGRGDTTQDHQGLQNASFFEPTRSRHLFIYVMYLFTCSLSDASRQYLFITALTPSLKLHYNLY